MAFLNFISLIIGMIGIIVIVIGLVQGVWLILKYFVKGTSHKHERSVLDHIRLDIGRYIILGLEFFIAKDIIETLIVPTLEELGTLAILVVVRTILSFFLTREIHQIEAQRIEHRKIDAGVQ